MGSKYGVPNSFLIMLYHTNIILTKKCNESCRADFLRGCDNNDASVCSHSVRQEQSYTNKPTLENTVS